jgi:hypothetical protein
MSHGGLYVFLVARGKAVGWLVYGRPEVFVFEFII